MARPHESCPVIVLLFIAALAISAGCDYVPNHDIVVIGLHPDGTFAWSRTLDHGADDVASDIVELPDGDFMIAAGNAGRQYESPVPALVRLSHNGTIVSEHPCPAMGSELTALVPSGNGTLAAATFGGRTGWFDAAGNLSGSADSGLWDVWSVAAGPDCTIAIAGTITDWYPAGTVAAYDPNGTLTTRPPRAAEAVETPGCHETVLEAGDRRIPVTECVSDRKMAQQAGLAVIARNGTVLQRNGYGAYGFASAWSIAPAGDGNGYLLGGFGSGPDGSTGHRLAARIARNGSIAWISDLGPVFAYYPPAWIPGPGNAREIVDAVNPSGNDAGNSLPGIVTFGADGKITGRQEIAGSRFIIPAGDGGFFSAGFSAGSGTDRFTEMTGTGGAGLHALKFRADGSREWDRGISGVRIDTVKKIIRSSDGGYVILGMRENR